MTLVWNAVGSAELSTTEPPFAGLAAARVDSAGRIHHVMRYFSF